MNLRVETGADSTQRRLKLLIVVTRMDVGGVPEHIMLLLAQLSGRYDCTIACREIFPQHRTRLQTAGVSIELIDLARTPDLPRDIKALLRLARFIRRGRFDIIHSHMSKGGLIGGLAGRLARAPLVLYTAHNFGVLALTNPVVRRLYWLYDRLLFSLTIDHLVTISRIQADQVVAGRLIGRTRVSTVLNGIDSAALRRVASTGVTRSELGVAEDAIVVITVARLVSFKAIDQLIEAVALLGERGRACRFWVVGDGDRRVHLERLIEERGLTGRVTLLGERTDVPRLLALADIFALPSVSEGMPIAIMEAMALGLPVVATAVDGTPELVVEGETGCLVPARDPAALASTIGRLIGDEAGRRRMGEAGRARIEACFTDVIMGEGTHRLYQRLLST